MQAIVRTSLVLLSLLTFGCTISTPFRGPGYDRGSGVTVAGNNTVIVSLTNAVLHDDGKLRDTFDRYVEQVVDSLEGREGLVGYSLRRQLLGNEAWTMTVWRDENSLRQFVNSGPHQAAIREAFPSLKSARFARVEVSRDEIPISWERAEQLLEQSTRGYEPASQ